MTRLAKLIEENGGVRNVLLLPSVKKDLSSVRFEDTFLSGEPLAKEMRTPGFKSGFDMVDNVEVLWCAAAGDLMFPVAFVIYADASDALHAYIPNHGNFFNHMERKAWVIGDDVKFAFDMDQMRTELLAHFDDVFPRTVEVPTGANQVVVKFKKVHPDAQLPKYAHEGDAGMDVCAVDDVKLAIGKPTLVKTGLVAEIPIGYEIQVRPRSGLALKGVTVFNAPGTIDAKYRGEIGVVLYAVKGNITISSGTVDVLEKGWQTHSQEYFQIKKGDRIAQLVLAPVTTCIPLETDEVNDTDRGTGGFGSTGV